MSQRKELLEHLQTYIHQYALLLASKKKKKERYLTNQDIQGNSRKLLEQDKTQNFRVLFETWIGWGIGYYMGQVKIDAPNMCVFGSD